MAGRLSEVKNWNVLLVEAGPDEPAGSEIPGNLQLYLGKASFFRFARATRTSNEMVKRNFVFFNQAAIWIGNTKRRTNLTPV